MIVDLSASLAHKGSICLQHCSASDKLLGHAPVWLSCIILVVVGGIVGAVCGAFAMLFRTRRLQRANHSTNDSLYLAPYQPAAILQVDTGVLGSTLSDQVANPAHRRWQPLLSVLSQSATMQAQDSAYKSTWRSAPSASHLGCGIATSSSKATSLFERQTKNPLDQRLLQEDAIRRSGVSGPLGMGVVMQSEFYKVQCYSKPQLAVQLQH